MWHSHTHTHTHTHTFTHTQGLIEQAVTTDGSEHCRCLCVLLLSIVNKDLLFFIIESYDWLVAHEARAYTHTHTHTHRQMQIKRVLVLIGFVLLLRHTPPDTDPLTTGGP